MSNLDQSTEISCDIAAGCNAIKQLIKPNVKDLGGFSVRRALPNQAVKRVGPWVFFDHMGPATFDAGQGINVRPHPHINIATVTYLFDGEILHRDSIGSVQAIRPGDLNLMVSGSGIVHSERESPEVKNKQHSIHGLQLWLALPVEEEEVDAAFYHYPSADLPKVEFDGVSIRVMIGAAFGVVSPVKTFSPTLYIEAQMKNGVCLELPNAMQRGLYVVQGEVSIGNTKVAQHTMVVLDNQESVIINALCDSKIALIGGDDVGHRYLDWNFVSSSKERIDVAIKQWIDRKFAEIEGDSNEYIPYPQHKK